MVDGAPRGRRVTITDVARAAMVAPSTVSKALNHGDEIPERTRVHIEETARRLGYRPNSLARGLRAGVSRTLGAVTDDAEGMFSTTIARSLEAHAAERSYSVFLSNSLGERERERRHIETFLDKQVDAILIMDAVVRARGPVAAPTGGTPVVYVYCYSTDLDVPSIVPDDRQGGRIAAEHLLALGRRRIAYIGGPAFGASSYEAGPRRYEGYLAAHQAAGVTVDPVLSVHADWDARTGYDAMGRLLDLPEPPDSVLCSNDYVAVGAIEAIRLRGLTVPGDIAVVGFDDRVIAAGLPVPLTTVAVDHDEMGRLAMVQVFDALDGRPQTRQLIEAPSRLIVRESTTGRNAVDA